MNAPEKDTPYFQTARLYLEGLILDETLTCNYIKTGRYGRDVVRCYLGELDIGAQLVRAGLVKDHASFSKGYYQRDEITAQKEGLGMWSQ